MINFRPRCLVIMSHLWESESQRELTSSLGSYLDKRNATRAGYLVRGREWRGNGLGQFPTSLEKLTQLRGV